VRQSNHTWYVGCKIGNVTEYAHSEDLPAARNAALQQVRTKLATQSRDNAAAIVSAEANLLLLRQQYQALVDAHASAMKLTENK
jgi:hypothetical protein